MRVFTLGLARTSAPLTLTSLYRPPSSATVPGLVDAECLTPMLLGSPILSPKRMQLRTGHFAALGKRRRHRRVHEHIQAWPIDRCRMALSNDFTSPMGIRARIRISPRVHRRIRPAVPRSRLHPRTNEVPRNPPFRPVGQTGRTLVRDNPEASFSRCNPSPKDHRHVLHLELSASDDRHGEGAERGKPTQTPFCSYERAGAPRFSPRIHHPPLSARR